MIVTTGKVECYPIDCKAPEKQRNKLFRQFNPVLKDRDLNKNEGIKPLLEMVWLTDTKHINQTKPNSQIHSGTHSSRTDLYVDGNGRPSDFQDENYNCKNQQRLSPTDWRTNINHSDCSSTTFFTANTRSPNFSTYYARQSPIARTLNQERSNVLNQCSQYQSQSIPKLDGEKNGASIITVRSRLLPTSTSDSTRDLATGPSLKVTSNISHSQVYSNTTPPLSLPLDSPTFASLIAEDTMSVESFPCNSKYQKNLERYFSPLASEPSISDVSTTCNSLRDVPLDHSAISFNSTISIISGSDRKSEFYNSIQSVSNTYHYHEKFENNEGCTDETVNIDHNLDTSDNQDDNSPYLVQEEEETEYHSSSSGYNASYDNSTGYDHDLDENEVDQGKPQRCYITQSKDSRLRQQLILPLGINDSDQISSRSSSFQHSDIFHTIPEHYTQDQHSFQRKKMKSTSRRRRYPKYRKRAKPDLEMRVEVMKEFQNIMGWEYDRNSPNEMQCDQHDSDVVNDVSHVNKIEEEFPILGKCQEFPFIKEEMRFEVRGSKRRRADVFEEISADSSLTFEKDVVTLHNPYDDNDVELGVTETKHGNSFYSHLQLDTACSTMAHDESENNIITEESANLPIKTIDNTSKNHGENYDTQSKLSTITTRIGPIPSFIFHKTLHSINDCKIDEEASKTNENVVTRKESTSWEPFESEPSPAHKSSGYGLNNKPVTLNRRQDTLHVKPTVSIISWHAERKELEEFAKYKQRWGILEKILLVVIVISILLLIGLVIVVILKKYS